jgi:replicative DNA helicase
MDERQPPHDPEAEKAVLGAVLIKPDVFEEIQGLVTANDFMIPANREVFEAMAELDRKGKPIDVIVLKDELKDRGAIYRLEEGPAYLIALAKAVPTAENVEHYARLVHSKAMLRRLIMTCTELSSMAYGKSATAEDLLATAREEMAKLEVDGDSSEIPRVGETLAAALDEIERRCRGDGTAVKSSISSLQAKTGGYKPGQLIVVAAATGEGKSAFAAVQEALGAAVDQGIPALVSSHEMARQDLIERCLGQRAGVEVWRIVNGRLQTPEWKKLQGCAGGALHDAPLFIDDRPHNLPKLCGHIRRWHARHVRAKGHRMALVVVDYLQLVDAAAGKTATREREVAAVSRAMKLLAKDLGIAVILVSQLSRAYQQRGGRPMLSDLRESGAIEQDADVVLFIHCDAPAENRKARSESGPRELIVGKQRQGWTGTIDVVWTRETMRFDPSAADEDDSAKDTPPNWQDRNDQ